MAGRLALATGPFRRRKAAPSTRLAFVLTIASAPAVAIAAALTLPIFPNGILAVCIAQRPARHRVRA
jgi:hypothetical protein